MGGNHDQEKMELQTVRIPLINFTKESESDLELKQATISSMRHFVPYENDTIRSQPHPLEHFIPIKNPKIPTDYCLQIKPSKDEEPFSTLLRALVIFKLFKDYPLIYSPLVLFPDKDTLEKIRAFQNDVFIDSTFKYMFHPRYAPPFPDTDAPYEIKTTEESEFRSFWEEFLGLPGENFGLSHFLEADYRLKPEDCITDYVEALEFLLVPDSKGGEISFKFRSRGALIIGRNKSPTERKAIFDELKNAYNLRSNIVHGTATKVNNWEEEIGKVRNHTREAIKYFFRKGCLDHNDNRRKFIECKTILEPRLSQP